MRKKGLSLVAIITGFVGVVSITSCNKEEVDDNSNEITEKGIEWSSDYSHDEVNHWHNSTNDEYDYVHGLEKHSFENDTCTKCGYHKENATVVNTDSVKEIIMYDHIQTSGRETKVLQKVFNKGDTFNTTNLALKVVKTENRKDKTEILNLSDVTITQPDMTTEGVKEVKIAYGDKEISYNITVLDLSNVNKEEVKVEVDCNSEPSISGNTVKVKNINDAVMIFKLLKTSDNQTKEIKVSEGKYFEKVEFDIPNIKLIGLGSDASKTIIEYNLFAEVRTPGSLTTGYSTDGGASVSIRKNATGFSASNITFQNYWNTHARFLESKELADQINTDKTRSAQTQAVACLVQADKCTFDNVRFSGYHDTLYSQIGRHIYKNCYIEGRTDYVFGTTATSYFKNCTLNTIGANDARNGGYVVATMGSDNNGSTSSLIEYGYIFDGCTFTADSNTQDGTVSLGRFWKDNMRMAVINSNISSAYSKNPVGSSDPKNTRYTKMSSANAVTPSQLIEYNNTGAGALTETTPGVIDGLCRIASNGDADTLKDYSVIFAKQNGNFEYSSSWNGEEGALIPTTYNFVGLANRSMAESQPEGDNLCNGDITIKGRYRIESSKALIQVEVGTVIEINKSGSVSVGWFGGGYGKADNATISYKNGKATITIDDLAGENGIYFSTIELNPNEPGIHEHVFDGEYVYEAPTLDSTGKVYKLCTDCENNPASKSTEVVLPQLDDSNYTIKEYTLPATTTEKGKAIYNITIDGILYEFEGETPMLEAGQHNHVYEADWHISLPTNSETGSAYKDCTADGCTNPVDRITVVLPILTDSNYEITNNTATISATGTGTYTITVDGYTVSFEAETPIKELTQITTKYSYTYANSQMNDGEYIAFIDCQDDSSKQIKLTHQRNSTIKLNVKMGSTIIVHSTYISGSWGGLNIEGKNYDQVNITHTVLADGIIELKTSTTEGVTQCAIDSISVIAPVSPISESVTLTFGTNQTNTEHIKIQSKKDYIDMNGILLEVDATSGKLDNTANATWAQFNNNTEISFKVLDGASVTINCMQNTYSYKIGSEEYVAATGISTTFEVDGDSTITIKATSNTWIGSIVVEYE